MEENPIRPAVPINPEAAIFHFLNVRTPRRLEEDLALPRLIRLSDSLQQASGIDSTLLKDLPDAPVSSEELTGFLNKAVHNYRIDLNFANQRQQVLVELGGLIRFGRWLRERQASLTHDAVNQASNQFQFSNASGEQLAIVWKALVASTLLGGSQDERDDLMAVLRGQHFLDYRDNAGDVPLALQQLAGAEVVLPADILQRTQALAPAANLPVLPPAPSAEQAAQVQLLADYEQALAELRHLAAVRLEEVRNTPVPFVPQHGEEPSTEQAAQAAAYANAQHRTQYVDTPDGLSARTQQLLTQIGSLTKLQIPFLLTQLEQRAAAQNLQTNQRAASGREVFVSDTGIWAAPYSELESEQPRDTPHIRRDNDPYQGFYTDTDTDSPDGRIRPLGIGDLLRVEQTLCCYKAGEVAHIENVMQGEYKERATRHLQSTVTSTTVTTEHSEEQERDTTTTDRYELTKATAATLAQNQSSSLNVSASGGYGPVSVSTSASFTSASASTQADQQTAASAKEVTDRAVQRIVEKVTTQRTVTTTEEFEENNKHGLDNRGGTKHVVGLYRWVDKLYTAQVVNYGKRLMFEFMVPEPSNFHLWAKYKQAQLSPGNTQLALPDDPRTKPLGSNSPLASAGTLSPTNYQAWAAKYGAEVEAPPAEFVSLGVTMAGNTEADHVAGLSKDLQVPAGYAAITYSGVANVRWTTSETPTILLLIGDESTWIPLRNNRPRAGERFPVPPIGTPSTTPPPVNSFIRALTGIVPISFQTDLSGIYSVNVVVTCQRLPTTLEAWQLKTYQAILGAYQAQKDAYDQALADAQARLNASQDSINHLEGTNPAYNKTIIQNELKKGCINWLFNGQDFSNWGVWNYNSSNNTPPVVGTHPAMVAALERSQFVEQCFEWELLSYSLYPYFWATPSRWSLLYSLNDTDPLFQNFLQAGMARVLVSVRPGYEQAALHFLSTGRVWNGGHRPGLDSPLYLSIVDELRPTSQPVRVGEPWEIRIPSTLTVLQADSGAIDGQGLPCDCEPEHALGPHSSPLTGKKDG